ncbi:MAG: hypothetical protein U1F71_02155 [Verrucomicrobiaceae bacterium]
MEEISNQPPPRKGAWWFGWIAGAIIFPAIGGGLFFKRPDVMMLLGGFFCVVSLVLHLKASLSLTRNGWLIFLLIIGGWALMAAAFFIGCAATYSYV